MVDRHPIAAAGLIGLLTLMAYWPSLGNGYIWDDDEYVTGNPHLDDLSGLGRIWFTIGATPQYYPLTHTSFWVEKHLWGLNPRGFHLTNILLHAANAILVWRLLSQLHLFQRAGPSSTPAWVAAAIFALHPVMVESVAWITERKNVLSGVLALLSLHTYLRWETQRQTRGYVAALLLFLAALFSKTTAVVLPPVILLLAWHRRGRITRHDVRATLPFFAVGILMGMVTLWMEKVVVGAQGDAFELSLIERFLLAGRALWFYVWKMIWPAELIFIYRRWDIDPREAWQYLFPLAALAVMLALWLLRRRIGRGPLTGMLYFAGVLSPALGFFDVYPMRFSFVADHFNYLAAVGVIALVIGAGVKLIPPRRHAPVVMLLLAVLMTLTLRQQSMYRDQQTLWEATLARNPQAVIARNNLGLILVEQGRLDQAIEHYRQALNTDPAYVETMNNLGNALKQRGQYAEAEQVLRRAIELKPFYAKARVNLASLLYDLDPRNPEAAEQLATSLQYRRDLPEAHYLMGVILAQRDQPRQASAHFMAALALRPDDVESRYQLGLALAGLGQFDAAAMALGRAIELDPRHARAHYFLGMVRLQQGRMNDAITEVRAALAIAPTHRPSLLFLIATHASHPDARLRDGAEALTLSQQAITRLGEDPELLDHLAAAHAEAGDFTSAVAAAERAIELAKHAGDAVRSAQIERRLTLYYQQQPYRGPF